MPFTPTVAPFLDGEDWRNSRLTQLIKELRQYLQGIVAASDLGQDIGGGEYPILLTKNGQHLDGSGHSVFNFLHWFGTGNTEAAMSVVRDVVSYGAVGDGVTDDSGAIQTAFDEMSADGGIILFPPGQYLCETEIYVNNSSTEATNNVSVIGCGQCSTLIFGDAATDGLIVSAGTFRTEIAKIRITRQTLDTAGSTSGIKINACEQPIVSDVAIEGFAYGILLAGQSNDAILQYLRIANIEVAAIFSYVGTGADTSTRIIIDGSRLNANTGVIGLLEGMRHSIISSNFIYGAEQGISLYGAPTGGLANITIVGNVITDNTDGTFNGQGILIPVSGDNVSGVIIDGNNLTRNDFGVMILTAPFGSTRAVSVCGNVISRNLSDGISITSLGNQGHSVSANVCHSNGTPGNFDAGILIGTGGGGE